MGNGNGKDQSADTRMEHGFEEDEEEFNLPDSVGNYNEDEEVIPMRAASPLSVAEPAGAGPKHGPISEPAPGGSHARGGMQAPVKEVQLSGVQERNSVHAELGPDTEIGAVGSKPSETQAGSSGEQADLAQEPRRRRRWPRNVLIAAILMAAAGAGYWFWPFGELAPALAGVFFQQPEPGTTNLTEAEWAPTPDQPPLGILGKRLDALSRDIAALESDGAPEDINAFLGDQALGNFHPATQPSAELASLPPEPADLSPGEAGATGVANARLEEIESLLAGLTERLIFLEEERREIPKSAPAPADISTPVMQEPEDAAALATTILPEVRATLPEIQPALLAESEPARASIAECGADERAVVEPLGVLQVAAHEGADGRRWARVIGPRWRRDLVSGERLPIGNPGEARMWVDEVGVFGVVELPGRAPCRVLWEGNK